MNSSFFSPSKQYYNSNYSYVLSQFQTSFIFLFYIFSNQKNHNFYNQYQRGGLSYFPNPYNSPFFLYLLPFLHIVQLFDKTASIQEMIKAVHFEKVYSRTKGPFYIYVCYFFFCFFCFFKCYPILRPNIFGINFFGFIHAK